MYKNNLNFKTCVIITPITSEMRRYGSGIISKFINYPNKSGMAYIKQLTQFVDMAASPYEFLFVYNNEKSEWGLKREERQSTSYT